MISISRNCVWNLCWIYSVNHICPACVVYKGTCIFCCSLKIQACVIFVVNTIPTDGLAPLDFKTSAHTEMIKCESRTNTTLTLAECFLYVRGKWYRLWWHHTTGLLYRWRISSIIQRHRNHPSIIKIKDNNPHNNMFQFQCINHSDVMKIINNFDGKKAHGYDRMPMKLLQKSAVYIASDIAKMINDSMTKCVFPDSLKFAEVPSLFKKKDTLNKVNYRPVSILVALSNTYEKAVGVQLTGYFNSIFSILLSAFRKGYSCQSVLLNMTEKFKSALGKGEFVACISMDFSKAFDCLPHCLMICKLFSYGLSREAYAFITSYLFQRK